MAVSLTLKGCCTLSKLLGGGNRYIQYPFHITGIQNVKVENYVNIGRGALIMTSRAQLHIKRHFVSGPGLTIITGDHMPMIGKFLDTVTNEDKDKYDVDHRYDQGVTIEEDVWCGANVTILKGVTIGRGAIIASGSIVTNSILPYCIAAGIPAKPIKVRWTTEQILAHGKELYPEELRLSNVYLDSIQSEINKH